ncbi:MAG: methylmalonyl-CoA mutase [Winogradskyella sp.]|uniref:methylmalonyl-CoA mutase subunit beta n=1 Tax=Winogradskyella sp. TaxID=1883156 RepID=UPI0017BBFA63|nr:methylmalonyl-CoA mutase subunit beta [Winogradskyella sp.]MBT8245501.1 methylmalonyl-CoA mutase subunit beta [Winogradskyella sp.]NNK23886.1 methylmalonyl-CoA mutase [Winogradskyella sp.]
MSKSLFKDFNSVSSKEWKQKIQVDLKGADYNDTLIWKTAEGIDVKPFYHADEFDELPSISNTKAIDWKISQSITVIDVIKANTEAKDALARGAEHIIFNLETEDVNIVDLAKGIDSQIHLNVKKLTNTLIQQATKNNNISINNDTIGYLGKTGNWFHNLKKDHLVLEESIKNTNKLYIDLSHYQNAGATNVQELAYALAHINEYLNHFENKNWSLSEVEVTFNIAIAGNYFFEIAKLRALRNLWHTLSKTFNANSDCKIIATPSKRNKTIYDYNVNMLRTTTECMSAILGGANIICNQPYNYLFQNSTEFGERISRNQLLILKSESYFDAVNNPSDGSYYIESLTNQLAEKALELFKDIEKNGGFLSQLKEGTVQRKIKESASKEQKAFDKGEITLLGTNKHPNSTDQMKSTLEKEPFLKVEKRKTLIEPIIEKRLSEKLEIKRLKEE